MITKMHTMIVQSMRVDSYSFVLKEKLWLKAKLARSKSTEAAEATDFKAMPPCPSKT
jgi:hypothetical protein